MRAHITITTLSEGITCLHNHCINLMQIALYWTLITTLLQLTASRATTLWLKQTTLFLQCTLLRLSFPSYVSPSSPSPLPVSDLFFTITVPPTINMGTEVTTVCPIPNIPQATVMAENPLGTNDITYCNVTSERGSFRSRSVTVVDPTQQGLFALVLIITHLLRLVGQRWPTG